MLLIHLHSENKLSKRFSIGLEEQIKKWDADKIKKFHECWYFSANATLYIVGDIDNIYHIKDVFGQTEMDNESNSAPSSSAFGAMASFLVPKLAVGLSSNSTHDRSFVSLDQSKALRKERHAMRSLPGHNDDTKTP